MTVCLPHRQYYDILADVSQYDVVIWDYIRGTAFLNRVSLAHNFSFWAKKLINCITFWAQKPTHCVNLYVQKINQFLKN